MADYFSKSWINMRMQYDDAARSDILINFLRKRLLTFSGSKYHIYIIYYYISYINTYFNYYGYESKNPSTHI